MNSAMAPLIEIYRANNMLLLNAVKDVKESDLSLRPDDKANSMLWIAGHMTDARYMATKMVGHEEECPWGDLFSRGEAVDNSAVPDMTEIVEVCNGISKTMLNVLTNAPDEILEAPSTLDLPVEDNNVLNGIAFLAMHDSYHIGQLAYIRRLLGYNQLVG